MNLLEIKNYSVSAGKNTDNKIILDNINFSITQGESLALIGESGSGKTTIARSILGLLDESLKIESGEILYNGQNILTLSEKEKTALRGRKISLLPQESLNALDPLAKCGVQIAEVLFSSGERDKRKVFESVLSMLSVCGFRNPEVIYNKYPVELSGGNRQKILFAISNISRPELLITDEPTSSLDMASEKEILSLLKKHKDENKQTLIFITHDISIAKEISDKIIVLKSGVIIESGYTAAIFNDPKEEYTKLLIDNAKSYN